MKDIYSISDSQGADLTTHQDTPVAAYRQDTYVVFNVDVHIQKTLDSLPPGEMIQVFLCVFFVLFFCLFFCIRGVGMLVHVSVLINIILSCELIYCKCPKILNTSFHTCFDLSFACSAVVS